jgi:hypothetical protein
VSVGSWAGLGSLKKPSKLPLLNKRTLYALDLTTPYSNQHQACGIPYLTGRARTFRSRARARCAAVSQTVRVGENSPRLSIPPQARKPCGFPILLWQTHSNYPSNHSSLPIRLLIPSHSRINNQNIFMSSGRFFLEPIRSLFPPDSAEYDDARTINRP